MGGKKAKLAGDGVVSESSINGAGKRGQTREKHMVARQKREEVRARNNKRCKNVKTGVVKKTQEGHEGLIQKDDI